MKLIRLIKTKTFIQYYNINVTHGTKRLQIFFDKISSSGKDEDITAEVKFVSAPKYRIDFSAKNYKDGESFIEKLTEELEEFGNSQKVEFKMLGEC